jgi:RNA polymerase sigma factor (sigma-70 family)
MNEQGSTAIDACVGGGCPYGTRGHRRRRYRPQLVACLPLPGRCTQLGLRDDPGCEVSDLTQEELNGHLLELREWIESRIFRRSRCADTVADAYQEVFIRALQIDPQTLAELKNAKTHVQAIINSLSVNHFRNRKNQLTDTGGGLEDMENLQSSERPHAPSSFEEIELRETELLVERLVQTLPPKWRQVYLLRAEGVPFAEIAKRLGIAMSTAKRRMRAAEEELAKAMAQAARPRQEGPHDKS